MLNVYLVLSSLLILWIAHCWSIEGVANQCAKLLVFLLASMGIFNFLVSIGYDMQ